MLTLSSDTVDKPLDLLYSLPMTIKEQTNTELHPEPSLDDELDLFTSGMAGTGASSPFIKDEPDDISFMNSFSPAQQPYHPHMNQQYPGQNQNQSSIVNSPSISMANGQYAHLGMNHQSNMSDGFNVGNSGINDDELLDLDLNDTSHQPNFQRGLHHGGNVQMFQGQTNQGGSRQINQQYSSTPDGAPIQSPFVHGGFNYGHFANLPQNMPHTSPQVRPSTGHPYPSSRPSQVAPNMHRQPSDSRSPMTPRTPGMSALQLETPQSGSLPTQPIGYSTKHQKRTSGQWDSNPDSAHSRGDTPISSPNYQPNQQQIAEMLATGKHASLPAKVEPSGHPYNNAQTQEAKRRRRRESHNLVERRRRDNINEKIQELSHLVPQHRLEDEKVRKHLMNSSPMSPSLVATGMSPPQATSMLAGGGRRATSGSISLGIPPDEKDKGPNKGDILNGSVSWTRDLMWALYQKLQQEDELAELIGNLGGRWPFQQSEDEKRMRSELLAAIDANDPGSFHYSRGLGSGLRVPNHTNTSGEALEHLQIGNRSPHSLSSGEQANGHHMSEINDINQEQQFWNPSFKEEDEYSMQLN